MLYRIAFRADTKSYPVQHEHLSDMLLSTLEEIGSERGGGGGGTLGISGWGCAAGTLEPLTYTRASSAEFCYPIQE